MRKIRKNIIKNKKSHPNHILLSFSRLLFFQLYSKQHRNSFRKYLNNRPNKQNFKILNTCIWIIFHSQINMLLNSESKVSWAIFNIKHQLCSLFSLSKPKSSGKSHNNSQKYPTIYFLQLQSIITLTTDFCQHATSSISWPSSHNHPLQVPIPMQPFIFWLPTAFQWFWRLISASWPKTNYMELSFYNIAKSSKN